MDRVMPESSASQSLRNVKNAVPCRACSFIYLQCFPSVVDHTAQSFNDGEATSLGNGCLAAAACALPKRLCWLPLTRQLFCYSCTNAAIVFPLIRTLGHRH